MSKQVSLIAQQMSWSDIAEYFDLQLLDARRRSIFDESSDFVVRPITLDVSAKQRECNEALLDKALIQLLGHSHFKIKNTDQATNLERWFITAIVEADANEFVIKLDTALGPIDSILVNHRVWEYLHQQGISQYEASLMIVDSCHHELMHVMDKIPGVPTEKPLLGQEPLLSQLVQYHNQLHNIKGQQFGLISIENSTAAQLAGVQASWFDALMVNFERHLYRLMASGTITKQLLSAIMAQYESNQSLFALDQGGLLHCDSFSGNYLWQNDKLSAVIDWEKAIIGDPNYEIAIWAFHYPEQFEQILQAYQPTPQFEDKEWLYRYMHYLLRYYVFSVIHDEVSIPKKANSAHNVNQWITSCYHKIAKFS